MKRLVPAVGFTAALLASAHVHGANPPGALDLPPSGVVPAPVDVSPTAPARVQQPADPSGNPLWAVPLSSLTATRERPIFLPSRRAPSLRCPHRASARSPSRRAAPRRRLLPARPW